VEHAPRIDELVAVVESQTADQPPAARLERAIALGRELAELSDELIGRFVAQARDAGLSWTEIGLVFGTSKQAVQQRFGAPRLEASGSPAQQIVGHASDEARRLGHDYVGTEHVLLVLAGRGVAGEVLAELGVTRERILATSCMEPGGHEPPDRMPLMPRLKQALEHSRRIAGDLGAADTEHVLAGLVAVRDSMAVEILRRLKVGPDAVLAALGRRLDVDPQELGAPRRRRRRFLEARR
jgi:Clp amino terminal domain, pathogenicity island component